MRTYFPAFKKSLLMVSGLCSIGTLGACDMMGIKNPLSSDRDPQVVEGGRHAPALNPRTTPPVAGSVAPSPVAPVQQSVAAAHGDPYGNDPYDYFNTSGTPAPASAPAASANVPAANTVSMPAPAAAPESQGNFFSRAFQSGDEQRKPLPGNVNGGSSSLAPAASPDVVAPAVAPQAKADAPGDQNAQPDFFSRVGGWFKSHSDTPADTPPATADSAPVKGEVPENAAPSSAPVDAYSAASAPASSTPASVPAKADDTAPVEGKTDNAAAQPSLAKRMVGWFDPKPETDVSQDEQLPQPPAGGNYPVLSSVPPTPDQFQTVKTEKAAKIQDMQTDHAIAMQGMQDLASEPSGQQASHPVDMPADNVLPPLAADVKTPAPSALPLAPPVAAAEDLSKPPLLPLAEAKPASSPAGGPVLLGHASTTSDQPFTTQNSGVNLPDATIATPAPAGNPLPLASSFDPSTASMPAPTAAMAPAADTISTTMPQPAQSATVIAPPAEKTYWWQHINPLTHKAEPADQSDASTAASTNAVAPTPAVDNTPVSNTLPLPDAALQSTPAPTTATAEPLSQPPMMDVSAGNNTPSAATLTPLVTPAPMPAAAPAPVAVVTPPPVQTVPPITVASPHTLPVFPGTTSAPAVPAAPATSATPDVTAAASTPAAAPGDVAAPDATQSVKTSDNPNDSALPTPDILKAARMLPPSRYSDRDQSTDNPATSY